VIQSLAHQHYIGSRLHQLPHLFDTFSFKTWLQFVLKELFSEQVQAVAGYASKYGMDYTRGEFAIGRIKEGTQNRHQKNEPTASKTLGERLSIPREEGYGSDYGQIEQAPFNAPVNGGTRTGVMAQLVQSRVYSSSCSASGRRNVYCNNLFKF
jgi:hypothetical protein